MGGSACVNDCDWGMVGKTSAYLFQERPSSFTENVTPKYGVDGVEIRKAHPKETGVRYRHTEILVHVGGPFRYWVPLAAVGPAFRRFLPVPSTRPVFGPAVGAFVNRSRLWVWRWLRSSRGCGGFVASGSRLALGLLAAAAVSCLLLGGRVRHTSAALLNYQRFRCVRETAKLESLACQVLK